MGILGTVLGFGLAGNGWVLPVFCRTDEPEEPRDGESPILPLVKHLNKDLFPFSPTSASGICVLVTVGFQIPLSFSNNSTLRYIPNRKTYICSRNVCRSITGNSKNMETTHVNNRIKCEIFIKILYVSTC